MGKPATIIPKRVFVITKTDADIALRAHCYDKSTAFNTFASVIGLLPGVGITWHRQGQGQMNSRAAGQTILLAAVVRARPSYFVLLGRYHC